MCVTREQPTGSICWGGEKLCRPVLFHFSNFFLSKHPYRLSLGSSLLLVPGSLIINTGYTNTLCLIGLDQSRFIALNACPSRLFRHRKLPVCCTKTFLLFIDARNKIIENVDRNRSDVDAISHFREMQIPASHLRLVHEFVLTLNNHCDVASAWCEEICNVMVTSLPGCMLTNAVPPSGSNSEANH